MCLGDCQIFFARLDIVLLYNFAEINISVLLENKKIGIIKKFKDCFFSKETYTRDETLADQIKKKEGQPQIVSHG